MSPAVPPEPGAVPLSASFQGPSGSRPLVARVWGAVQEPMRKQHRPWRSLIFGALTPTPACPAPAVAWVRASAECLLVADPTQSPACGWNAACRDQKEPSPCS